MTELDKYKRDQESTDVWLWVLAGVATILSVLLTGYMVFILKTEFAEGPVLHFGGEHVEQVAQQRQDRQTLIQQMKTAVVATYKGVSHKDAKKVVRLAVDESTKAGIDPTVMVAVIATESSFQPKAKSWYGAVGYTQVVPRLHKDKIKGRDIHDAKVNVEVGVKILAACYKRKKTDKAALACYNGSDSEASADRYFAKVTKARKTLTASL